MKYLTEESIRDLRAVAEAISLKPDSLFMPLYGRRDICGTVMCIAGHFLMLRGWEPVFLPGENDADHFCKNGKSLPASIAFYTELYGEIGADWADAVPATKTITAQCSWPEEAQRIYNCGSKAEGAKLAIESFIAQHSKPKDSCGTTGCVYTELAEDGESIGQPVHSDSL